MIRSWLAFISIAATALLIAVTSLTGIPANAQTATAATPAADVRTNTMVPSYDVTKEVKIQGTIQKIDSTGTNGITGTQILIQTANGVIDAHLGFGPASKPSYLGLAEGQSVTVVGMMQTMSGNSVLLARILTTANHIFVLRNEHGIPVRAIPHGSNHSGPVLNSLVIDGATFGRSVNA